MSIKVVVELTATSGRRDELRALLEELITGSDVEGFLGSTRYEVVGDPDTIVEIAEWVSVEARAAHMEQAAASGSYSPVFALLGAPFRATVITQLD